MIRFTKMHGLGNDYVFIDCINYKMEGYDFSDLARKMSDRHFGVGSDGIILIYRGESADFRMRMFNADGSEAEMCGNGIRCFGKYVYEQALTANTVISVETAVGIKQLNLNVVDHKVQSVRVDMGSPILDPKQIPVDSDSNKVEVEALDERVVLTCVSMGNPHAVMVVDQFTDEQVQTFGKALESGRWFPNRTNVEFIEVVDRSHIKMRVYERGTGETLACGTGACASVVACNLNGLVDRKVQVSLLGGDLEIEWADNDHVYMTGPATIVYDGIYFAE